MCAIFAGGRISSRRLLLGNSAVVSSDQRDIVIFILADPVNNCSDIEATQPRVSRAIVEDTEVGPISRQRTGQCERRRQELARDTETFCAGGRLKLSTGQVGAVDCRGQSAEISAAEAR